MLTVQVEAEAWFLPPTLALWIPAGLAHLTRSADDAWMRSPYFLPTRCPIPWSSATVVAVGPLLRELLDHLAVSDQHRRPPRRLCDPERLRRRLPPHDRRPARRLLRPPPRPAPPARQTRRPAHLTHATRIPGDPPSGFGELSPTHNNEDDPFLRPAQTGGSRALRANGRSIRSFPCDLR
ncbi:Putative AraC-family transcriptional regulator [Frankia alni ACN14a]|uniref:AraC-family transcriptional regulator n=1 Tax=Frankia alni (strain DSM 45986 / CECT 9034 / ACN14a) TaxID=326424 RepID=Q0RPE0_FRAAA|nr:Putative AraC-family transcriptional regulator [Frankia alni ACN14a]